MFLLNCRRMLLSGKQPRNNGKSRTPTKQLPPTSSPKVQQSNPGQGAKGKSGKYVNLYASDGRVQGDTILLKGRRHCDCQAAQHKLINNCLGCGRIVCEQEGSGPCLCCGDPVHTPEEEQQLAKAVREKGGSKASASASASASKQGKKNTKEALDKALAQRDRLLEYDKNSEKRTTVIDDELDYFQVGLTPKMMQF